MKILLNSGVEELLVYYGRARKAIFTTEDHPRGIQVGGQRGKAARAGTRGLRQR